MRSIHNFVIKVQNSDEVTKRFWVMVCSAISMLFVIALWLAYSNATIARVPGPANQLASASVQNSQVEKPGFLAIFGAGTKIIFDALKARLAVKNDIVIQKQEINFISENIEPVKGGQLPK